MDSKVPNFLKPFQSNNKIRILTTYKKNLNIHNENQITEVTINQDNAKVKIIIVFFDP